jgi:hypothetical protein
MNPDIILNLYHGESQMPAKKNLMFSWLLASTFYPKMRLNKQTSVKKRNKTFHNGHEQTLIFFRNNFQLYMDLTTFVTYVRHVTFLGCTLGKLPATLGIRRISR